MVVWYGVIKIYILECGSEVKEMDMDFLLKIMVIILKVNGLMIKEKVKVVIILIRVIKLSLENGLMIVLKMLYIVVLK